MGKTLASVQTHHFFIFTVLFAIFSGCNQPEKNNNEDIALIAFLTPILLRPECSSFSPQSAPTITSNTSGSFQFIPPNSSGTIAARVPAGKQCYFKFVAPTSDTYLINTRNEYNVLYHIGLANKNQTNLPAKSSSFDSENIFINLGSSTDFNDYVFYQKANSYRIILADATNCTSNCLITFGITKNTSRDACTSTRGSQQIPSSAVIRFDETGVSIPTLSSFSTFDCYYLFVSPLETISQLNQTNTYTGGTSVSMVLSVSSPVTSTTTTFVSSATNTSATTATISNLTTSAGQGRYVKGAYSNSNANDFSFRLSNSY
ncbi:hypothetical protein [Leptospira ryugenii]|uniref:hypothetical protein n=1 Tax=Leptospira ryugenii TaxID=1917863 RepID=UPI000D59FF5E|nr:hypothetical protein [Leptospira ryugenii]